MSDRVPGFRAAGVHCGIKASGRLDLALIVSERPATAAGLFTTNQFPGAPVIVSRRQMRRGRAQAIVVNSGISNVAMGARGLRDAERMVAFAAQETGVAPGDVQVSSTGVIGQPLPMAKIESGIRQAAAQLSASGMRDAARAILTTDTRPKLARAATRRYRVLGFAKGAGMIQPKMATMLAYVLTDAAVQPALLRRALREAAEPSLNRLTIDGATSTSDTVLVLANGAAAGSPIGTRSPGALGFCRALAEVCAGLAEQLALDGEGVTRLADVVVEGARSDADALAVARSVANSALVKTALFGADPNWGRIVQAIGAAGVRLDPSRVGIRIAGIWLLKKGEPTGGPAALRRAARAVRGRRIEIAIKLGTGAGRARMLTTDLSYEYVRINADYTT